MTGLRCSSARSGVLVERWLCCSRGSGLAGPGRCSQACAGNIKSGPRVRRPFESFELLLESENELVCCLCRAVSTISTVGHVDNFLRDSIHDSIRRNMPCFSTKKETAKLPLLVALRWHRVSTT